MMEEYEYGRSFQLKLLSLLVRKPEQVAQLIQPRYFTLDCYMDIAREVADAYAEHPNSRFSRATLIALLKDKLGKKKWLSLRDDYKRTVRELFELDTVDDDLAAKRAVEFARDSAYRKGLVLMEKFVNSKNFEAADRVLPELHLELEGHSSGQYDWNKLPRYNPATAPKTKWLCENFIPERSITFIVADAGSYKSTFMLALCKAISRGEDFLDLATRSRRVLYLDNENPPDVLRERNEAMRLELEANKRLRVWSMYGGVPLPKLGSPDLREIVKKSVAENRKPLIVFDHWASFLKPGDGGETTGQTSALLQELKYLCGLGATAVVLAHTLKYDPTTWYGGADIKAKADAMHTFVRKEDPVHPDRCIISIECFLKRHGGLHSFAIQPIIKNRRVIGFRSVEDPRKIERQKKIEKLRGLIKNNPDASQRELANLATAEGFGRDEAEALLKQGIGKFWKVRKGPRTKMIYVLRKISGGHMAV
jgi:AAA domain-containing protein